VRLAEPPRGGGAEETIPAADEELPPGIASGLFLHELLEGLSFPQAHGETLRRAVVQGLERHGLEPRWREAAERLVARLLDTPLDPGATLRLRQLPDGHRRNEMAFHFPLADLRPGPLQALLEAAGGGGGLDFPPLRGMMRGFIDLVFEHQGRYYLADYKSNHLGPRIEDYGAERLARAMRDHHYHLQYLIYTLALHRHLGRRLPGYRYRDHFGGVYYLFPRGMSPAHGPRYGVFHDRPEAALIERLDALFGGGA